MSPYDQLKNKLAHEQSTWLITGVAGFIGSNLLEALLKLDQKVIGLDNFSTGHQKNIDEALATANCQPPTANFQFIEGDIRNLEDCRKAMTFPSLSQEEGQTIPPLPPGEGRGEGSRVDYVLHQAALGSVPRSIKDPITTNQNNIDGFLNMLVAARDAKVKRFVYAASSSTYGDHPDLLKVEEKIGKPLSPYAITKVVNELYADVFAKTYDFKTIGLRYFNVFGKRQDPNGAYAAVIPKWVDALLKGEDVFINGDGETSRDFCYIDNAVQANLLAATVEDNISPLPQGDGQTIPPLPLGEGRGEGNKESPTNQVYNVAVGERTTLNQLYNQIKDGLTANCQLPVANLIYRDFRAGDVRHSLADIGKAKSLLGYQPSHRIDEGLKEALDWYVNHLMH